MTKRKIIYVSEELYKRIIEELGFVPSNLVVNKFLPDKNQAYVVDGKFFVGYEPTKFFNVN